MLVGIKPKEYFSSPQSKPEGDENQSFLAISIIMESLPALLFSVVGGILTGRLLERVQGWDAFIGVPEFFILLPVLMNLKGNLEMNLAAQLSTSANVGHLDTPDQLKSLFIGNLTLLQVRALIVSLIASSLSFLLGILSRNHLPSLKHIPPKPGKLIADIGWSNKLRGGYYEFLLLLSAGMLASSANCAFLGTLMCGLVITCRMFHFNPDNITTPVAASMGDLLTLIFLSLTASLFVKFAHTIASTVVFIILLSSIGFHCYITLKNDYVRQYLPVGWAPLILAMFISIMTGLILRNEISRFEGYAIIAPVLTGITGNIGTISICRISTSLHSKSLDKKKEDSLRVGLVLLGLSLTVLIGFTSWSCLVGNLKLSALFTFGFMICITVCSMVSLLLAYYLTHKLWDYGCDPDIYAIPLLNSMMDVIGQTMLVITFIIFHKIDRNKATIGPFI
ncbi:hypothetical protein PPACK8108_LOCUS12944 [Phakopsora pachyrhizi]|uniref:SLC41A/MgtE integral membrane domain-containing protein n=1 Tax=Phakopsora pachyrhizi TaxID=170000 RepID=A0AAV0B4S7_PHAPC|nr:hypothetical protein PPACK8108_LOCUS12944 [Phakopsora pachyrhizi]